MSAYSTKIEIYDTSDAAVYADSTSNALTTDILSCSIKQCLTTKPGSFTFTLPALKDSTKAYDDIGMNYKAKIYMGTPPLDASDLWMVGKILKVNSGGSTQNGLIRHFEGKDLGEQLERQFIYNTRWQDTEADDIAAELANNLSIYDAAKIATDTTDETVTIRTESYWSVLQKISDYWYDGSTKVQKDFYVNTANKLVWNARPFRTVGVEPLAYGSTTNNRTFLDYELIYDLHPSKNKITVYGAPSGYLPNDQDWAETLTDWTATIGTLSLTDTYTPQTGSYYVLCQYSDTTAPDYTQVVQFTRTLPSINLRDISKMHFYYYPGRSNPGMSYNHQQIRLLAPDLSNFFFIDLTGAADSWHEETITLGPENEYDASTNPGGWQINGSPNWWTLMGAQWYADANGVSGTILFAIDGLYFYPYRWTDSAEDAANQALYGLREAEYTDDNLLTNEECGKRAETLIMQQKDKTIALNCTLDFNSNILLGDRCPVTITHENLSGFNMDVVAVEHRNVGGVYSTIPSLVYSSDIRAFPPTSPAEALNRQLQGLKSVTSEAYMRVVR